MRLPCVATGAGRGGGFHRCRRTLLVMVTAPRSAVLPHAVLIVGLVLVLFPIYVAFVASSLTTQDILDAPMTLLPGPDLFANYREALAAGTAKTSGEPVGWMMLNSAIMALAIAVGKIAISLPSAYAVVFFRFPLRKACFWAIFATLMLPVEVRIIPTYKIVADLSLIDTYAGLTLPLIASATATLLFRQFFLTIPDELVEAAKIDGAGPLRFFIDTAIPLSRTNIAALFVILFIFGWNQYLWPLLVTNTPSMSTVVIGIRQMIGNGDSLTDWQLVMATAILAMLPPLAIVLLMQRWFVKGLVEAEK
jgi:sn-glycerol 3-phosphate transport system permease protein